MRFIQYHGMVHSKNDGTSFKDFGMGGCFMPTFVCTSNFSQIESNVLPIILIQSSDFLYLSFNEKAKARSFSIMFRSSSHQERTISYLSDRVPMTHLGLESAFLLIKNVGKQYDRLHFYWFL